jgi:NAD(P)-dependent dehydrogenase (short-subunit alcohol dehydrogenase family)
MPIETDMHGKVALVTGGASGIGAAVALEFAHQAAMVVVADIDEPRGKEVIAKIRAGGGEALFVKADVSKPADVEAMVKKTVTAYGGLHFAVNNAGIGGASARIADYPDAEWNHVIGVNLTGVWLGMKHEICQMVTQNGGVIVNMASMLGTIGFAGSSAYVAAKHAIVGLTKTAALEYAAEGIRVHAVCPGFIDTPLLVHMPERQRKQLASQHPLGRFGTPDEVAKAVVWLCSDGASFMTGESIVIDGGFTAK